MAKITLTIEPDRTGIITLRSLADSLEKAFAETEDSDKTAKPETKEALAETPAPEETKSEYTVEDIRAAIRAKTQEGKKTAVKELLELYGTENATGLDSKYYAAFLEKMKEL